MKIAFGPTVQELDISDSALTMSKTKFSMFLPEVETVLKKNNTKSVILVGIEVNNQLFLVIIIIRSVGALFPRALLVVETKGRHDKKRLTVYVKYPRGNVTQFVVVS